MKKALLLSVTLLSLTGLTPSIQAAPKAKDKEQRRAQIAELAKDKETRAMMIHQLMSTDTGKKELAAALKHDAQFRSYYDSNGLNPG